MHLSAHMHSGFPSVGRGSSRDLVSYVHTEITTTCLERKAWENARSHGGPRQALWVTFFTIGFEGVSYSLCCVLILKCAHSVL